MQSYTDNLRGQMCQQKPRWVTFAGFGTSNEDTDDTGDRIVINLSPQHSELNLVLSCSHGISEVALGPSPHRSHTAFSLRLAREHMFASASQVALWLIHITVPARARVPLQRGIALPDFKHFLTHSPFSPLGSPLSTYASLRTTEWRWYIMNPEQVLSVVPRVQHSAVAINQDAHNQVSSSVRGTTQQEQILVQSSTLILVTMEMELDIENMMLEEYLRYESEKESRLWKSVRSKGRTTRYKRGYVDSFYRKRNEESDEDDYYRLPLLKPCFKTPQPCTKLDSISHYSSKEVDIDSMTIKEYELYMAMQCSKTSGLENPTYGFTCL
ncbi:hypothetical protein Tco_0272191 [Tanacetum coccineum]